MLKFLMCRVSDPVLRTLTRTPARGQVRFQSQHIALLQPVARNTVDARA